MMNRSSASERALHNTTARKASSSYRLTVQERDCGTAGRAIGVSKFDKHHLSTYLFMF